MNVLFLSLSDYDTIYLHGLYSDLLKQFVEHGNKVYLIAPFERRSNKTETVIKEQGATIVKVKIWNMQKTNVIEKGLSMMTIDGLFFRAIKKYFGNIKFDLVLYPTPPITLLKSVEYVKNRDGARSYLLLKDIFPQNAVDIGLMSKTGLKGILYHHFRRQEKKLYAVSDRIGCMSPANVQYVIDHNPEVEPGKVEVCPNTTDPIDMSCSEEERREIRLKYDIPLDKTVFVYGGNLGKPQDIPFIIECIKACADIEQAYFLIIGNGTEYGKIERFVTEEKPKNLMLMQRIPKDDYDRMVGSCDVGLIFLDHRFTIPNFPSRLLGYMAAKLPVLACTDVNSDIGKTIVDGGFGWWCESDDVDMIETIVINITKEIDASQKQNAFEYLKNNFSSEMAFRIIHRSITNENTQHNSLL